MRVRTLCAISIILLSGCSSQVLDAFKKARDYLALGQEALIVLESNSTTENQPACTFANKVVIQISFPAGQTLYCRDVSKLGDGLKLGEVCAGGVRIVDLNTRPEIKECKQVSICGVAPSNSSTVGTKADGSEIRELTYSNLPWGCDANIEFSFDPEFASSSVRKLSFYVQPPECPFCERQNQATCGACTDLTSNEQVVSGQVVFKNCNGSNCAPCEVLHKSGEFVPHGEGKVYYKKETGGCDQRCTQQSLLRICNNGYWQGDLSYEWPSCVDSACGCKLVGDAQTYAHGSTKTIYQSSNPACGIDCSGNGLLLQCNDGTWQTGDPLRAVASSEWESYPAKTCVTRVCPCLRDQRETIADGQTKTVYSKQTAACGESCANFSGALTCNQGVLTATNAQYLNYGYDSCTQEDCGCKVSLADGKTVILQNGGSTTLYAYAQNSIAVPNACTDAQNRTTITCNNKTLSAYDTNKFRYSSCTSVALTCTFVDGLGKQVSVSPGASITVSKSITPDCGVACENLALNCVNGTFKKTNGTTPTSTELAAYQFATACTPKNCNCSINGNIVPYLGSDSQFYKVDKVTNCNLNGCKEAQATIQCLATGPVSSKGDDPNLYQHKTCEVIPCGCQLPWGGSIESGKNVRLYSIEGTTCSVPDACNDSNNFVSVSCTNAQLSSYNASTYKYQMCKAPVCSCFWDTLRVPIGDSITVYQANYPAAGRTCSDISATAKCLTGGVWEGADPLAFPKVYCSDTPDSGIGGGSGGGTGNDEGAGSGIRGRFGLGDGGPGGGNSYEVCIPTEKCYRYNATFLITTEKKRPCTLPWGGGEIEMYGTTSAFSTQCVVSPDKCSNHRIVRTCHFPKLTGDDSYRYPACQEKSSCP